MLCPIHATHHGRIVDDANLDRLEDVVRARKALEPNYTVELDISALVQLVQWLQDEVAGVRLLEGVVCGGGVFGHTRYASNAEGDAKKGEDGLAQVREGFGGVGRIVVEHGNEDVRGAKSFGELYDDSELVDEEVIGGVDDHANKVQLVMARKVLIRVLMLVLTKGAGEGRTESGHPTIQGKELLDGREDRLLVHVGCVMRENAARMRLGSTEYTTGYSLWLLESFPIVLNTVVYDAREDIGAFVPANASLKKLELASIELLVCTGDEIKYILFTDLVRVSSAVESSDGLGV